jgi:putative nucleotidyltransferase with HDIG domain
LARTVSLRWKVAVALTVLLVAVALVVGTALVRYERFFLLEEGKKRVESLAQTLAVSARDPLLIGRELRLGPITESIIQDPDTVYAYVLDHEGLVAYHPETKLIGKPLPANTHPASDRILEAVVPVEIEGTRVGTVVVGLSLDHVDRAVDTTARALLVRLGIGMLVGLAGTLFLTEWHVRRIEKLERAVSGLGGGNLSVKAEVGGRDEITRLAEGFNTMVKRLRKARRDIERGVTDTVSALATTIEVNDAYTHGHCERVAQGTRTVAERLGVQERDLQIYELAATLHDIGKIGVATGILAKPGKLTDAEFRAMQKHSELGAQILGSVGFLTDIAQYVLYHHEDWNGGGYPKGLSGKAVPLASRIIHVVDAFDAMTSSRPYRTALPQEEAVRRIRADRGRQFDPEVVDCLLGLVEEGAIAAIRRRIDEARVR